MELTFAEIMAELNELGRALFDAAQAKAANRKLVDRIAELETKLAERE